MMERDGLICFARYEPREVFWLCTTATIFGWKEITANLSADYLTELQSEQFFNGRYRRIEYVMSKDPRSRSRGSTFSKSLATQPPARAALPMKSVCLPLGGGLGKS